MARWTSLARGALALALIGVAGAAAGRGGIPPHDATGGSAGLAPLQDVSRPEFPGETYLDPTGWRAVLLADADLFEAPSTDSLLMASHPAGTILAFVSEATDVFGRTWSAVRDPVAARRRSDGYLAPFDYRTFTSLGGEAVFLADRPAVTVGTAGQAAARDDGSWWQPDATLSLGHSLVFDGIVGVSAVTVAERDAREAIALLGGPAELGNWPADPLPGELFVPELLQLLFQWDGAEWHLVRPVKLFGGSLNLLGNPTLQPDATALPVAGGPLVPCWSLVGSLDPRGRPTGRIQPVTQPPPPPQAWRNDPVAMAQRPAIDLMQPPATIEATVPPRLFAPQPVAGLQLHDEAARQAVYLEQTLGPEITGKLRSTEVVLDVWARTPPGATGPGTFGVDIESKDAAGGEAGAGAEGEGGRFANSFTVGVGTSRAEFAFTVPEDAEILTVRLLPLDRSVAVEQQGTVIFERVALRRPYWNPEPAASVFVLNRVSATSYEAVPRYTRAPLALTEREDSEIEQIWPAVAASDWSDDDKRLVLAGDVRHGMSPAQVRASWGDPKQEIGPDGLRGIDTQWNYPDRLAFFVGDKLVAFRLGDNPQQPTNVPIRCPGGSGH